MEGVLSSYSNRINHLRAGSVELVRPRHQAAQQLCGAGHLHRHGRGLCRGGQGGRGPGQTGAGHLGRGREFGPVPAHERAILCEGLKADLGHDLRAKTSLIRIWLTRGSGLSSVD
jgi:hypothetical protein